jgi:hypothetical protein
MAEIERVQARELPVELRDLLQPELAGVEPLELRVGAFGEAPQASYSPSSEKIRRMIATLEAYVESSP